MRTEGKSKKSGKEESRKKERGGSKEEKKRNEGEREKESERGWHGPGGEACRKSKGLGLKGREK